MNDTSLLKGYGVATHMLSPFSKLWIKKRLENGKEDPDRISERHGEASVPRPTGNLVWLHGASVGESMMLLPVISRLKSHDPALNILVTSGTVTSADILSKRLPEGAIHQYVPLDYPKAVDAFLDHWQPDLAIWSESEIWPNLIRKTKARKVPMVLLNARMSQKSIDGWEKRKKSAQRLFGAFDLILAANDQTAKGLGGILGEFVEMSGNLKDAAAPLPVDDEKLAAYKPALSRRKVWCAASTHEGEDEIVIKAHQALVARFPTACMILAPRHPERASAIRAQLAQAGLSYVAHSEGIPPNRSTQVLLLDTIGDMGLAYRLSQVTFVCGSLLEGLAGHNPLEPARLNNAVLTGKNISSFADTYMSMLAFNATKRILTTEDMIESITKLFEDKAELNAFRENATAFASSRDSVLDFVWEQMRPFLPSEAYDESA